MSDPPKYHELVDQDARPASMPEEDDEAADVVDGMPLLFRDGALEIAMEEPIEAWYGFLPRRPGQRAFARR